MLGIAEIQRQHLKYRRMRR